MPAGLVDEGESAEEAAIRELREETGYVGVLEEGLGGGSGVMFNGECMTTFASMSLFFCRLPYGSPSNLGR